MNGLKRLVLAGLIVLGVVSSAGAECGWILWGTTDDRPVPAPVTASPTLDDCLAGVERMEKKALEYKRSDGMAVRCWPGAFDPTRWPAKSRNGR